MIVREEDCGTDRSLPMRIGDTLPDGSVRKLPNIESTGTGRTLSEDVVGKDGTVLAEAGADMTEALIDAAVAAGVASVRTFSVLVCQAKDRCLRQVLRPVAGHGQAGGTRAKGGGYHRRPVDR